METLTGYTILLDPQTHYWVYAVRSSAGVLTPATGAAGELIVGKSNPAALSKAARPLAPLRSRAAVSRASAKANIGTQKVLVLLVQFSDQAPVGSDDATYWHDLYFGATNSVKDYYTGLPYIGLFCPELYGLDFLKFSPSSA
jgi:hypothetical protein